jgi:hypothetical protein
VGSLLVLALAGCAEPSVVLVSVEGVPAGTLVLSARYELDERPSTLRSSWPPPTAGWQERFTFVVALPDDTKGRLGVELAARDADNCLVGTATVDLLLEGEDREGVTATVVPLLDALCGDCDEDEDGFTDDGCLAEAPVLVAPENGHWTGVGAGARSPILRWRPVAGAAWYETQIDDGCAPWTGLAACLPRTMPLRVDGTSLRPTLDLSSPGHHVVWRVRGCTDAGCGPWSARRYLHAGRSPRDLDGDGVDNLIVAVPSAREGIAPAGRVLVYPRLGAVEPPVELRNRDREAEKYGNFGNRADGIGDLDGDGYPELLVTDPAFNLNPGVSGMILYPGGPAGPSDERSLLFKEGVTFDFFRPVGGDVDGDGFGDIVVGWLGRDNHDILVYFGGPGFPGTPLVLPLPLEFVNLVGSDYPRDVAVGDWDGDGFADVAASGPGINGGAGLLVFARGRADRDLARSFEVRRDLEHTQDGWALASGDMNGDGVDELVAVAVGAEGCELLILEGTGAPRVLPIPFTSDERPWRLFLHDLDDDGRDEAVIGGWGRVEVFAFDDTLGLHGTDTILDANRTFGNSGTAIDPGDGVPRLVVGVPEEAVGTAAGAGTLRYRDGTWKTIMNPTPTPGAKFAWWLP